MLARAILGGSYRIAAKRSSPASTRAIRFLSAEAAVDDPETKSRAAEKGRTENKAKESRSRSFLFNMPIFQELTLQSEMVLSEPSANVPTLSVSWSAPMFTSRRNSVNLRAASRNEEHEMHFYN